MSDEQELTNLSEQDVKFLHTMPDRIGALERQMDTISVILDNGNEAEPEHDKLFTALAKAQSEITAAELDAEGQAGTRVYSYATLTSVMTAIRAPLSKNGLSIIQLPTRHKVDGGEMLGLTTILAHSSGQSISNKFEMYPPKQDPQGIGSAMTYMRRYTVMAIVGIAGANDDDAEGTKAEAKTISAAEADAILSLADDLFGDDANALLARMCDKVFGVDSIPKIPEGQADVALNRIKNTRKRKDDEKAEKKPKPSA
jgi:hypothetical protein